MKIGIIGQGSFGAFAAKVLADAGQEVVVCDKQRTAPDQGFKKATQADALILAVPLSAYNELLPKLKLFLDPATLVIDICSVKTEASSRLHKHLLKHKNLLVTHPMFGPQSAAGGAKGHVLVVTESHGDLAEKTVQFCSSKLGLKIMRMSAEEHDRSMADVHALTFFIARALSRLNLQASPFQAPSFQALLDLVAFDRSHSEDLFRTIELGNPFAQKSRNKLITALQHVHDQLERQRV